MAWATLLFAITLGPAARADGDREKQAESLFREGRAAVNRGDIAVACARFRESLELSRRASTLLNLASCEEQQGHLIAALGHWREGLALLPSRDERSIVAKKRVEALDARMPLLTLRPPASPPAGLLVALDGKELGAASLGSAQAVDPGEHVVVVTAPGRLSVRSTVRLAEGEQREIAIEPGAPVAPADVGTGRNGVRTAGFVVGGAGLAGFAVSAIFGGLTIAKKGTVDDLCRHPSTCTSQAAKDAATSGKAFGAASTAAFVIGGAALATGIVLVVVGRPSAPPTAALGVAPTPGGLAVSLSGRL